MTMQNSTVNYDVTSLEMPVYFNAHGDHDPNGLIFALTKNVPILKYIRALAAKDMLPEWHPEAKNWQAEAEEWHSEAQKRADKIGVVLPSSPEEARKPHLLVRPLVLRAWLSQPITVTLRNEIGSG